MANNRIQWNPIQADFRGSNQAVSNAIQGLSQAGTIFGNLNKQLTDVAKQESDAAFRERELQEKSLQAGLNRELDKEKIAVQRSQLAEQERANKETEQLRKKQFDTVLEDRARAADQRTFTAQYFTDLTQNNQKVQNEIDTRQRVLDTTPDIPLEERKALTDELKLLKSTTKRFLTAVGQAADYDAAYSAKFGESAPKTFIHEKAALEVANTTRAIERDDTYNKSLRESYTKAMSGFNENNQILATQGWQLAKEYGVELEYMQLISGLTPEDRSWLNPAGWFGSNQSPLELLRDMSANGENSRLLRALLAAKQKDFDGFANLSGFGLSGNKQSSGVTATGKQDASDEEYRKMYEQERRQLIMTNPGYTDLTVKDREELIRRVEKRLSKEGKN